MLLSAMLSASLAFAALPAGVPPLPAEHSATTTDRAQRIMIEVSAPQGDVTVRIQPRSSDPDVVNPHCADGGMELEVVRGRDHIGPDLADWLDLTCGQLHRVTPQRDSLVERALLRLGIHHDARHWVVAGPAVPAPPDGRRQPTYWPLRPLHLPLIVAFFAALLLAPKRRAPYGWAALAVILRWGLTAPHTFMGISYPYMRLGTATGLGGSPSPYGDAWAALMGSAWFISGAYPNHVFITNAVLSVLSVLALWAVVQRTAGERAANIAAAMLACHPVAIALARTETMFGMVALLQLMAVWGAVTRGKRGDVLSVASTLLLVHARPFQIFFAPIIALILGVHRRWVGVVVVLLAIAERAWSITALMNEAGGVPTSAGANTLNQLLTPHHMLGHGGALIGLDPTTTPLALALLLGAGLVIRHPKRRVAFAMVGLWLVSNGPYLHFHRPTDVLRFALPGVAWWCAAAAIGLLALPSRWRGWAVVAVAFTTYVARQPLGPRAIWSLEHDAVMEATARTPSTTIIWYDDAWDGAGQFRDWMTQQGRGVWKPFGTGTPQYGDLAWMGRATTWPNAAVWPCEADAVEPRLVEGSWFKVEPETVGPVMMGLHRLHHCPLPATEP